MNFDCSFFFVQEVMVNKGLPPYSGSQGKQVTNNDFISTDECDLFFLLLKRRKKCLHLVIPKKNGKGTINNILRGLVFLC